MAHAIESCVHCGFCLPACPTYRELGEEMDSPRGRIFLMKSALEGGLTVAETLPFVDRCLACLGCVTACPSGVPYGELISAYRAHAEPLRSRPVMASVRRTLVQQTLPHPGRFRVAATLGRAARPLHGLTPRSLRPMLGLLPEKLPAAQPLPGIYPAIGTRRARVALLAGCVQQALDPDINWATLRVLAANGVETVIPAGQGCCGALDMHLGATRARPGLCPPQHGGLPARRGCDHHQRGRVRVGDARVSAAVRGATRRLKKPRSSHSARWISASFWPSWAS